MEASPLMLSAISFIALTLTLLTSALAYLWRRKQTRSNPLQYGWLDSQGNLRISVKPWLTHLVDCGLIYPGIYGNVWFLIWLTQRQFV